MITSSTVRAALRLPLAASLFGARQLLRAGGFGSSGDFRTASANFYRVAGIAQAQFDSDPLSFVIYQLGDQAQRALTDLVFDVLTLRIFAPSYLRTRTVALAQISSDAFHSLAPGEAMGLTVAQILNNFTVINLVNGVDAPVELDGQGDYPLDEALEKLYASGEYPALWSIEGLGENYASAYLNAKRQVRGLLTTGKGAFLPEKSLLMMHAGAGIAFAKRIMATITPWSSDAEFTVALRNFLSLVGQNSRPGYQGPALESLGLVTRTWHKEMVEPVSRHLAAIDSSAVEYFWHGAGRAMYFSPLNFVPGFSPFYAAEQEPTEQMARRNARAGVAWAFTLVNIQQPEIMANFLRRKNEEIAGNDGFSNGAISALIMAGEIVPNDVFVSKFCSYQPASNDPALVDLWRAYIGENCAGRISHYRQALRSRGKLGEIFRYHKVEEFPGKLGNGRNPLMAERSA